MHSCVAVFFLVPAGQSPQLDDRPRFPFPFGHAVQKVAEVMFVNMFIPQDLHDVIPGWLSYVPGRQEKQNLNSSSS